METAMRSLAFGAVLFTAAATSLYAQGVVSQQAAPDAVPVPPEQAVAPVTSQRVPEPPAPGGGKPANICLELLAFIEQRTQSAAQRAPAQQSAPQAAPVPQAPPLVDVPQQRSGIVAPVPPPESGQKPPFVTLEQARAYVNANDVLACQVAARQMRRACVPMPDGLIALAALRPDLLRTALDAE
jgi:hypothetical protein